MVNFIVEKAKAYATIAHQGQTRKYAPDGQAKEPFVNHPIRVQEEIAKLGFGPEEQAVALLHDTIEDCPFVKYDDIEREFGGYIAHGVLWLTNPSKHYKEFSRAKRKLIDRNFISVAPRQFQTIKAVDRTDNMRGIHLAEVDFQQLYYWESLSLYTTLLETIANTTAMNLLKSELDLTERRLKKLDKFYVQA